MIIDGWTLSYYYSGHFCEGKVDCDEQKKVSGDETAKIADESRCKNIE